MTIVDRRQSASNYSYVVPGRVSASASGSASCFGDSATVNCVGTSRGAATVTLPRPISYDVRGATYTLRLPDERLVIVNCESKYALKADYINRRSCRMPLVDNIEVEFDGDKAKLFWPVSVDGRKFQSETYTILGVLPAEATP